MSDTKKVRVPLRMKGMERALYGYSPDADVWLPIQVDTSGRLKAVES